MVKRASFGRKTMKNKTVLSVRDFAILYNLIIEKIIRREWEAENSSRVYKYDLVTIDEKKKIAILEKDLCYQDLLRLRESFGKLNVEIETSRVEVEYET